MLTLALTLCLSQAPAAFQWELPRNVVSDVPIDGTLRVGGIPVRLRRVVVKGVAGDVGRHFLDSFKRQGLYVPPGMPYDRVLTGVRPTDLHTFSVLLDTPAKGFVGVLVGEADPGSAKSPQPPATVPTLPGATEVLLTRMEGAELLSYRVQASAADVQSFHQSLADSRGLLRDAEGVYRAEDDELRVSSTDDPGAPGTQRVSVLFRGAAR